MPHHRLGPCQIQAAIAALHARAACPEDTGRVGIQRLYQAPESRAPFPVITLNRDVAILKLQRPQVAREIMEPLAAALDGYFSSTGRGGTLLRELGRMDEDREAPPCHRAGQHRR